MSGIAVRNRSLVARLRWWLLPWAGYLYEPDWRDWHTAVGWVLWRIDTVLGWLPGSRLFR